MIEGHVSDFGETYQWIFSPPESRTRWQAQHEFVKWLRSGTEIFWINGKPGSGKSTLMDFIYQNLQPKELGFSHLEAWAGLRPVRLLSFWFFRPATSVLLKSLQGFWRSLCFQILDNDRDLADNIQQDTGHSVPEALKSCLQVPGSHSQSWTDAELKTWFTYLITHSEYHYCLLIDGLDEVTDNRQALLDIVQEIAHDSKKIKICCSSRPEAPFARVLERYPSLRLQDFNFEDIEKHCRNRLDGTRAVVYVDTIARRAEGVFLWAYLVTEDLRSAVNQGDTEEDLNLRLKECPGGMNELFTFLLERQDTFYAKHPKPYLRLLDVASKKNNQVTVLELFIASEDQEKVRSRFPVNLVDDDHDEYSAALDSSVVDLEVNVVARCAGLVECTHNSLRGRPFPDTYPYKNLAKMRDTKVKFIHRSAQDFLAEGEKGSALLQSCSISEQDALKRLMTASALTYLINRVDTDVDTPLYYARCIHGGSWTAFETSMADNLFSAQHLRKPSKTFYGFSELVVTCPQLSPVENLTFWLTAGFRLAAYLAAKLTVYDPAKSSLLAGFSMYLLVNDLTVRHYVLDDTDADFIGMLQPYLRHTQTLTLHYHAPARVTGNISYAASRPIWQHIYLALTSWFFELGPKSRKDGGLNPLFDFILSSSNGEGVVPECWILGISGGREARIIPEPDDTDDAAVSNKADTCGSDIFKIRMTVHGFGELSGSSMDFLQFSPGGLDRFFEIEPSMNETLRRTLDHLPLGEALGFVRGDMAPGRNMATILNGHLDELSPADVADVVCLHRYRSSFAFSKGRIHGTTDDEKTAWEKRLQGGNFDDDFETDPEHDPILCEILKRLQHEWAEEALLYATWTALPDSSDDDSESYDEGCGERCSERRDER